MLLGIFLVSQSRNSLSQAKPKVLDLPQVNAQSQRLHAQELAPLLLESSTVSDRDALSTSHFVFEMILTSLPEANKSQARAIASAVIEEANSHGMDPIFVLAVIATESQFKINAEGYHGERGLMQILPTTAKWWAGKIGLNEDLDLYDPIVNIRIGVSYMAQLRSKFQGRVNRYVGAYNMGSANVRKLVASKREPRIYPDRVLLQYAKLYVSAPHDSSLDGQLGRLASAP